MNVTGIAPDWVTGLQYAAIWAETSSLFSDWDAGFVRMSQGSAPDWVTGLQYAAIWAETSSLFSEQRPRDMTQRNMTQRNMTQRNMTQRYDSET